MLTQLYYKFVIIKMCLLFWFQFLFDLFGVKEFLPSDWFTKWLATDVCSPTSEIFCSSILFIICGFDVNNLNEVSIYLIKSL